MFAYSKCLSARPALRALITAGLVGVSVSVSGWVTARHSRAVASAANEPYQPCPVRGSACRILPLGDSLTWGIGYDGGYRVALFEAARAAGKQISFTGSLQNGPWLSNGTRFPRNHEGRSGWTIEQIATTVPKPALNTLPHIVLLHAGTNDVYAHASAAAMAAQLDALLDRLERTAPQALIVVATILPLTDPELRNAAQAYNEELKRRVQARKARGEHLIIADQFDGFPTAMLSDGVHPTQTGYERMAHVWYAAIAPY